jgi:hypothetical protein
MILTTAQLQALKADIAANSDLNVFPNNSDGNFAIAALYNALAAVDFWVWRTTVTKAEYTQSTSIDGTTFNWTGAGFITRSVGEQNAWAELFNHTQSVNPSLPNVRQAFADILSGGTAPAPANRTHMLTVSRRKASRVEKVLATGVGSTASPGTMGSEGPIAYQDIEQARNS